VQLDSLLLYLATGAVSGLAAGLFGVGGGLIIVPALAGLLSYQGGAAAMQTAIATSLAVMCLTSISSMRAHNGRGGVLWPVFWRLAPGIVIGSLLGATVAQGLGGTTLRRVIGCGALLIALQLLIDAKPKVVRSLPGSAGLASVGAVIGALSALIGIGGGSLTVPYLAHRGVEMRQAVGTSSACGVPIAWAGTLAFALGGLGVPGRPAFSLGYVDLTAFIGIAAMSVLTAPLGARLAHRWPQRTLKRAFGVFLTFIGVRMLWF
jgi:hypothetical protein